MISLFPLLLQVDERMVAARGVSALRSKGMQSGSGHSSPHSSHDPGIQKRALRKPVFTITSELQRPVACAGE